MRQSTLHSQRTVPFFEEVRTGMVLVGKEVVLGVVGVEGRGGGRGETCGW